MSTEALAARVRQWIEGDPDPVTRDELSTLLESRAWEALEDRFESDLTFGTAGLRGIDGGGPNRMNVAVVMRASYGLAQVLQQSGLDGPVVVGRDARERSLEYFEATIEVLSAAGFDVRYFSDPIPTPLVAFASLDLGAIAAVVITASHNPPEYNGYKVYNEHGSQIVPPLDSHIARAIELAPPATMIPRSADLGFPVGPEMVDRYLQAVVVPATNRQSIAYTALHGVGGAMARKVLTASGHELHVADDQFEPDPEFPSVRFPNPEEPGAMDQVMELGKARSTDLVFANDPDADRLAVGTPGRGLLTGNQLGVLLVDGVLTRWATSERPIVASTVVSTPMARLVAEARGAHFEETLTGFKWIWFAVLRLEDDGAGRFAVGFEEALGYSVTGVVRDKDGLATASLVAAISGELGRSGRTLWDRLDELNGEFGTWRSTQRSIVRTGLDGQAQLDRAVATLASGPPAELAGRAVTEVLDYRSGQEHRPPWLPNTNMVALRMDDGRVVVRPSGTEPKLKIYVDLASDTEGDLAAVADAAVASLEI